jgi:Na+-translocating ferredoxin:NAD+ oxidoreductase RNF subunit RnfB
MEVIITIVALSSLGVALAVILFIIAQQFKVIEDPRIDEVEEALPGANCGGCGYPGCRGFAEACVKADSLDSLFCPVGGNDCTADIAKILGMEASAKEPQVAVVRCFGVPENRKKTTNYDGAESCKIASNLYSGDTGCPNGCLGLGDCVDVCSFDAIYIDKKTGLPVVDEEKCTACGACVTECPKDIIELRNAGKKSRRIFVSCVNHDKGGVAKKSCSSACIGCSKCAKVCKFDAITIENFCAYIDYEKCKLCRKCAPECPTGAIHELNFPPRKEKPAAPKKEVKTNDEKPAAKKEAAAPKEKTEEVKKPAAVKTEEAPKAEEPKKEAVEKEEKPAAPQSNTQKEEKKEDPIVVEKPKTEETPVQEKKEEQPEAKTIVEPKVEKPSNKSDNDYLLKKLIAFAEDAELRDDKSTALNTYYELYEMQESESIARKIQKLGGNIESIPQKKEEKTNSSDLTSDYQYKKLIAFAEDAISRKDYASAINTYYELQELNPDDNTLADKIDALKKEMN